MNQFCKRCDAKPVKARGLCGTCGEYERRHGRPRPDELTSRQYELNRRAADRRAEREMVRDYLERLKR